MKIAIAESDADPDTEIFNYSHKKHLASAPTSVRDTDNKMPILTIPVASG